MGLDLGLAAIVLIAAIRGWLKGFLSQAIGLAALVGCVYLATPLSDAARPHARQYLPSMSPDVLDRLLWWSCAVLTYIAATGVAHGLLRLKRKQPYGLAEPNRANQGAGFVLGGLKGAVVACFLAAGFAQFAPKYMPEDNAVATHAKSSICLSWNARYQPANRLWNSSAVQKFVGEIRKHGLGENVVEPPAAEATAEAEQPNGPPKESHRDDPPTEPIRTARKPAELQIPERSRLDPASPTFREDLARELSRLPFTSDNSR